jgi:hypothetical protein
MYDIAAKSRRKYTIRKTRCRWVVNIRMELREIGWGCVDWIDLVED